MQSKNLTTKLDNFNNNMCTFNYLKQFICPLYFAYTNFNNCQPMRNITMLPACNIYKDLWMLKFGKQIRIRKQLWIDTNLRYNNECWVAGLCYKSLDRKDTWIIIKNQNRSNLRLERVVRSKLKHQSSRNIRHGKMVI